MTALPRLDNARARALFLHRHGLAEPPSGPGRGEDLRGVIGDLGFVQLDSISTVARAHHMILHARRTAYRPGALHRLHDRERAVFEHWTHDASMIDMRWFPHWRHRFRRDAAELDARWSGRDFRPRLDAVLRRIADEGPCAVGDLEDETPRGPGVWWNWTPTKAALEYLWRAGHLSVARREAFRKVYDLTENVIPAQHLNAARSEDETLHWACNAALDRLGFATSGELAAFWDLVSPADAKAWTAEALARGEIVEAEIEQADRRLRRVVLRPETLDAADLDVPGPAAPSRLRVLSPFDPALRDRNRAERLFGFHYRIEIFVPEARRAYGYYVFPLLEGDRIVGRIDVKADRAADRLQVRALWPERGVRFGSGRRTRLEAALARTARLADVSRFGFDDGWLRAPGGRSA